MLKTTNMKNNILIIIALLLLCDLLPAQVQPTWESINERGYPQWFSDAKLGIFIHWGVYSVHLHPLGCVFRARLRQP